MSSNPNDTTPDAPYTSQPVATNASTAPVRLNASLPITRTDAAPGRVDLGMNGASQPTVWSAVNYPTEGQFDFEAYFLRYERQAEAKAIIDKPVNDTWQDSPTIQDEATKDQEDDQTEFERQCQQFFAGEHTRRQPTHRLNVADKLARLGEHSLVVLGFSGGDDLSTPVAGVTDDDTPQFGGLDDLHYIATFGQDRIISMEIETDMTSPRYRLPVEFEVLTQESNEEDINLQDDDYDSQVIHWSRCLFIPEGTLEDDLHGTPALKPVFHELLNIDKIKAASGEGYWRAGYQGMLISPPRDEHGRMMQFEDGSEGIEKEIDEFIANFKRTIAAQAEIETLDSSVGDPNPHLDANYQAIAAALDIPKSILTGKDVADTADSTNLQQWHQHIMQRRRDHAEHNIVEPLIKRLIDVGVLPEPEGEGFVVEWPPLDEPSESEQIEMKLQEAQALKELAPGNDPTHLATIPELRHQFGWNPELGTELPDGVDPADFEADDDLAIDEADLEAFFADQDQDQDQPPEGDGDGDGGGDGSRPPEVPA